jgi:hypothetical protein
MKLIVRAPTDLLSKILRVLAPEAYDRRRLGLLSQGQLSFTADECAPGVVLVGALEGRLSVNPEDISWV